MSEEHKHLLGGSLREPETNLPVETKETAVNVDSVKTALLDFRADCTEKSHEHAMAVLYYKWYEKYLVVPSSMFPLAASLIVTLLVYHYGNDSSIAPADYASAVCLFLASVIAILIKYFNATESIEKHTSHANQYGNLCTFIDLYLSMGASKRGDMVLIITWIGSSRDSLNSNRPFVPPEALANKSMKSIRKAWGFSETELSSI